MVGLGCNNFGRPGTATEHDASAVVDAAIEAGVTLFDTADIYNAGRSEELLGQALADRRGQVVIATKWGHQSATAPGADDWGAKGSRGYIRRAIEASLTRLGTDYIDVYQLHTPDPGTPIEQTLEALDELVQEGLVRHLGHSNFDAAQMREADAVARERGLTRFVSAQNEYSLLRRQIEEQDLAVARELGLGVLPFFPLASGLLTGKYRKDQIPEGARLASRRDQLTDLLGEAGWDGLERYLAVCAEAGITPLEGAVGWLLAQDGVTSVISGATSAEQVRANAAAGAVDLSRDTVTRLAGAFDA